MYMYTCLLLSHSRRNELILSPKPPQLQKPDGPTASREQKQPGRKSGPVRAGRERYSREGSLADVDTNKEPLAVLPATIEDSFTSGKLQPPATSASTRHARPVSVRRAEKVSRQVS